MLDGLSIYALSLQCALSAPADVAASVALYESHGNPFAVKINNLPIDTNSEASAIATVSEAIVNSEFVMFGIGMVSTQDAENAGLSVKAAFSPCANLKLLSEILAQHHEKASGEGTAQWLKASAMNGTGTGEGEVAQAYIAGIEKIRVRFDGLSENPATLHRTQDTVSEIAKEANGQQPQATKTVSHSWDVFGENSGHSVLIYQGKTTQ